MDFGGLRSLILVQELLLALDTHETFISHTFLTHLSLFFFPQEQVKSVVDDFSEWQSSVEETSRQVEALLQHWQDYDSMFELLSGWLNDMESKVKAVTELKATLPEKKAYCDRYKVSLIKEKKGRVEGEVKEQGCIMTACLNSSVAGSMIWKAK